MTKHKWTRGNLKSYARWSQMMGRCYNEDHPKYKDYGGRGITVCDRWHHPHLFYEDMGDAPEGMTMDRVDNDQGYTRENTQWATPTQQNANRRRVGRLPGGVNSKPNANQINRVYVGETEITLREAAERCGRTYKGMISRMRKITDKFGYTVFQLEELIKK